MSAATLNTFPPVHTFHSSRSWAMAIIVLLHMGFFWALTTGMAVSVTKALIGPSEVVSLPDDPSLRPPPPKPIEVVVQTVHPPIVPEYVPPDFETVEPPTVIHERAETPTVPGGLTEPRHTPVVVQPESDPRGGLSQPDYPAPDIRAGNEGTVILSLQVLETGRVGEVRIEHSSGFVRLDNSAVREARRWRFRPGTRDGVPVVMWKQLPVTFRLQQ